MMIKLGDKVVVTSPGIHFGETGTVVQEQVADGFNMISYKVSFSAREDWFDSRQLELSPEQKPIFDIESIKRMCTAHNTCQDGCPAYREDKLCLLGWSGTRHDMLDNDMLDKISNLVEAATTWSKMPSSFVDGIRVRPTCGTRKGQEAVVVGKGKVPTAAVRTVRFGDGCCEEYCVSQLVRC